MALSPDIRKVDTRFLHFLLSETRLSDHSESTALPALNGGTISAIQILLPPIDEQRVIAASLADAIEEVYHLHALISKRRDIQTAVTQQLLKGTTRLPGFVDEWRTINLGDYAAFSKGHGLSKKLLADRGMRSCLLYGELFTTYGRVIDSVISRTNSYEGAMSRFGDVLLPGSTTTTGADLATASALLLDDVQLSGDVNIIRPDLTRVNPTYLAYHLTVEQRDAIAMRTQGITIHHLYGKHLADLEVRLPSLAEQIAIAQVLTDMQLNIEALEKQRSKAEMIKQGMMSDLLSGKVRLV
jgi:type I restriction enzyme S subunit